MGLQAADGTMATPVPSFGFPGNAINGPGTQYIPQVSSGSNAGVPGNNSVTSTTGAGADPIAANVAYGKATASAGAARSPFFWAVVLMVIAVWMFAHVSRLEIK